MDWICVDVFGFGGLWCGWCIFCVLGLDWCQCRVWWCFDYVFGWLIEWYNYYFGLLLVIGGRWVSFLLS